MAWSYRDITPTPGVLTSLDVTAAVAGQFHLTGIAITGIDTSQSDAAAWVEVGLSDPNSDATFFLTKLTSGYYGPINPIGWTGRVLYDNTMILRARFLGFTLIATRVAYLLEPD